jgi:hypothetical protein
MANRYPLVVDSSSSVIKELPSADSLELGGSDISNVGNINVTVSANLGAVGNITITGGSAGQVLKTNGSGVLSWGADSASAGGANTQVQFNDGGSLAGNSNLTFNKTTSNLTLTGNIIVTGSISATGNANVTGTANVGNVYSTGTITSVGNLTAGNISATLGTTAMKDGTFSNSAVIANTGYLKLNTVTDNSKFVAFQGPNSIGSSYILWQLPNTAGSVGQFLTQDGNGIMNWGNVTISSTVPTTASDTGTAGQIAYDSTYVYICIATNTWKRAALSTW